ncbi:MAG: CHAP domain-containing protein [Candidatus Helarchaeota archaeon]
MPSSTGKIGNGSCIDYIKYRLDIYGKLVSPKYIWANIQETGFKKAVMPERGSLMITSEGPVWHIVFIESVNSDFIHISEQNYVGVGIYSERTFDRSDNRIVGFIRLR